MNSKRKRSWRWRWAGDCVGNPPRCVSRPGQDTKSELENGPVEIVDLPVKNGGFP